jgi:glycosyltransferase involved in cell wall biosynthesis
VICLDLLKQVEKEGYADRAILLENFVDLDTEEYTADEIRKKREEFASGDKRVVLYAGNFQPYQGISLLLEAASRIANDRIVFLLVGESAAAVEREKVRARKLGIVDRVFFTGQVPPSQMALFIGLADVLVSPRLSGTNTPLKIYSFLKSGKPLVATNLWTHTQVLTDRISVLVEPDANCLAEGIVFALFDSRAQEKAKYAKEMADRDYTYPRYKEKISQILAKAGSQRT